MNLSIVLKAVVRRRSSVADCGTLSLVWTNRREMPTTTLPYAEDDETPMPVTIMQVPKTQMPKTQMPVQVPTL